MIDETTTGGRVEAPRLELEAESLTIRDLISLRVRAEVRRFNNERPERFQGLVEPTTLEKLINGKKESSFKPIDADRQVDVALQAFRDQRFLVLLPKGQAESLDETVQLTEGDEVSFLRLVPLIGG